MIIKFNNVKKTKYISRNNSVFFAKEKFEINSLKKFFKSNEINYINQILKKKNIEKKILSFDLDSKRTIILIKVTKDTSYENLGAEFYSFIKQNDILKIDLFSETSKILSHGFFDTFLHGFRLKSYEFNNYKSVKEKRYITINLVSKENKTDSKFKKFQAIEFGTNFARDLVSEPPNVLYPKEYVNRLLKLKKFGIKVTVYNESKLKSLGMNSLLGVGRGSAKESFLVTLEWYGDKKNKNHPLSFVGNGVCFDTGVISLIPA